MTNDASGITQASGTPRRAALRVIAGPMFSGKSDALIRRAAEAIGRLGAARVRVMAPAADTRTVGDVASRTGARLTAERFTGAPSVPPGVEEAYIDELHLGEAGTPAAEVAAAVLAMAASGVRVTVAGLDLDASRTPFESVRSLMASADQVDMLTARCGRCGAPAAFTERSSGPGPRFQVGDADMYRPTCGPCATPALEVGT